MRQAVGALEVLFQPLRGLVLRIAAKAYRAGTVEGFELIDLSTHGMRTEVLRDRLAAAVRTIKQYDRRRATRLSKDLKRFVVTDAEGGEFIPSIQACMLSGSYISRASAEELAAMIVHEGTHARLWTSRIRYTRELRERIERVCVRQEIDFARRLSSGSYLVADAEARLQRSWWTDEQEFERRLRQLEQLGRPVWYRRLYRWMRAPR